jgi:hypothetical protein
MPKESTMTEPTTSLGRAYDISVVGDEDGFELHFSSTTGDYVVNIHGVAQLLLDAANKEIGGWYREGQAAAADYAHVRAVGGFACDPDESGGYDPSDPKHRNWHSVHADLYDQREGK